MPVNYFMTQKRSAQSTKSMEKKNRDSRFTVWTEKRRLTDVYYYFLSNIVEYSLQN